MLHCQIPFEGDAGTGGFFFSLSLLLPLYSLLCFLLPLLFITLFDLFLSRMLGSDSLHVVPDEKNKADKRYEAQKNSKDAVDGLAIHKTNFRVAESDNLSFTAALSSAGTLSKRVTETLILLILLILSEPK